MANTWTGAPGGLACVCPFPAHTWVSVCLGASTALIQCRLEEELGGEASAYTMEDAHLEMGLAWCWGQDRRHRCMGREEAEQEPK